MFKITIFTDDIFLWSANVSTHIFVNFQHFFLDVKCQVLSHRVHVIVKLKLHGIPGMEYVQWAADSYFEQSIMIIISERAH